MNKYKSLAKSIRKEKIKARMCDDKKAYDTEEESVQKGQRNYLCKYCNKWHRSGNFTEFVVKLQNKAKS